MRLFCSEKQILAETEKLYCEAVVFYYELLKDRNELWTENLLTIQGQLEKLTVLGKDGRVPEYLPPGLIRPWDSHAVPSLSWQRNHI